MYVDGVVLVALRSALPGVTVGTRQPADITSRLPCVVAVAVGGQDLQLPVRAARPTVQIDAYASSRRAASDLADQAAAALRTAWRTARVTPDGVIAGMTTVSRPAEIREADQLDDLARWSATYQLTIRT